MFLKKPNGRFRADIFIHCWVRPVEDWIQDRRDTMLENKRNDSRGGSSGDSSESFPAQACGHEFESLTPMWKASVAKQSQHWGGRDRWIPGVHWTLSLPLSVSFRSCERLCFQKLTWRVIKKDAQQSTSGCHIHIRTNTCTPIPPPKTDTRRCSTGIQK